MSESRWVCATCGLPAVSVDVVNWSLACGLHRSANRPAPLSGFDKDFWDYAVEMQEPNQDGFTEGLYCFFIPGVRPAQSFRLAFVTDHVMVYGDLSPGRRVHDNKGIISTAGYGRAWFVNATSPDYLAEKFGLEKVFDSASAATYLRECAAEWRTDGNGRRAERLEELAERAESVDQADVADVADFLGEVEAADVTSSGEWAFGHDFTNLTLLCAIQRRFRRFWLTRGAS